jgi:hypothetical protein
MCAMDWGGDKVEKTSYDVTSINIMQHEDNI